MLLQETYLTPKPDVPYKIIMSTLWCLVDVAAAN